VILVTCGIRSENREAAEREILSQIRALAEGDFREEELEAAKKSLGNACRQMEDSPAELKGFYYSRALVGNPVTAQETKDRMNAVSADEIMAAARGLSVDVTYFLEGTDDNEEDDDDGEEI
jgi:predicted Zn-dependent peptidase